MSTSLPLAASDAPVAPEDGRSDAVLNRQGVRMGTRGRPRVRARYSPSAP